jgi:hypothetical protein
MWDAIAALAARLEAMADGRCEQAFFLSSLDPGVGKTQTVIHFLRALLASPKHKDVGVILCMFSIDEITDVAPKVSDNPEDYGVLTSDNDANQLGNPDANAARILFTTQQRVQKVCNGRSFDEVLKFHYRGAPRRVRIWDESLLPAEPITVGRLDIARLLGLLPHYHMPLVHELEALSAKLKDMPDRTVMDIPDYAERHHLKTFQMQRLIEGQPDDLNQIALNLWSMFGTTVCVRRDGERGGTLVTTRNSIPLDLAPLVILDASGRVKTTYTWWEERRGTLIRLPPAIKNYDQLTVHVWPIGGGAWAFEEEDQYEVRCKGIVDLLNSKPEERWLVVCHKVAEKRLMRDITRQFRGNSDHLEFLHWGEHRATNQYGHIANVILAGTKFYRHSTYDAKGRAASGVPPDRQFSEQEERELEIGEHCDLLLQAICRGAARTSDGDGCAPCNAYIIATERVTNRLSSIFPSCRITPWLEWDEEYPSLTHKAFQAIKFIDQWIEDHPGELLRFKTVMDAIGEKDRSNFSRSVCNDPGFQWALGAIGVCEESLGKQRAKGYRRMTGRDYFPADD